MPSVPRREQQLAPNVVEGPGYHATAGADAFGAAIGKGLQALGAGTDDLGEAFAQHAVQMKQQDNATEVDDLVTKGMLSINDLNYGDDGYYTKKGAQAVDAFPQAKDALVKIKDDLGAQASNPAVAKAFDTAIRPQIIYNLQGMSSHYTGERKAYQTDVYKGKIATLENSAGLNYANKDMFNGTIAQITATIAQNAVDNGQPVEYAHAQLADSLHKIYGKAIGMQGLNDPVGAMAEANAHRDDLGAEQYLAISKSLQVPLDLLDVDKILNSQKIGQPHPGTAIPTFTNVAAATAAVQKIVPGAVFTRGADTVKHNAAIGGAPNSLHLAGQAADFVPPKGMTIEQLGDSLKKNLGPDVKVLVEGPGAKYSTGPHVHIQWGTKTVGPTNPTPMDIKKDGEAYIAGAVAQAKEARPGDPQFWQLVETKAKGEVSEARQSALLNSQIGQQAWTDSINTDLMNGQKPNLQAMLSNPTLAAAINTQDPLVAHKMIAMATAAARGPITITQEMQDHYKYLNGMANGDVKQFLNYKLAGDPLLTPAWTNKLLGMQIKLSTHKDPNDINSPLNHALGMKDIKASMQAMKLAPNPAHPNTTQHKNYLQFLGEYESMINTYIQTEGKAPKDPELRHMFNQLATIPNKQATFGKYWSWEHAGETQLIQGVPNHRAQAIADYLRDNNIEATPDSIKYYYEHSPGEKK